MKKEEVYDFLDSKKINYRKEEHEAVYTILEMKAVGSKYCNQVAKNLFLKDDKHKTYYLLVVDGDKRVNINELRKKLGTNRMSFANDEDLMKYLGLTKGAVSPLGVLNDKESDVVVVIDEVVMEWDEVAVHPNENTASVWLKPNDLVKIIKDSGNEVRIMKV